MVPGTKQYILLGMMLGRTVLSNSRVLAIDSLNKSMMRIFGTFEKKLAAVWLTIHFLICGVVTSHWWRPLFVDSV